MIVRNTNMLAFKIISQLGTSCIYYCYAIYSHRLFQLRINSQSKCHYNFNRHLHSHNYTVVVIQTYIIYVCHYSYIINVLYICVDEFALCGNVEYLTFYIVERRRICIMQYIDDTILYINKHRVLKIQINIKQ